MALISVCLRCVCGDCVVERSEGNGKRGVLAVMQAASSSSCRKLVKDFCGFDFRFLRPLCSMRVSSTVAGSARLLVKKLQVTSRSKARVVSVKVRVVSGREAYLSSLVCMVLVRYPWYRSRSVFGAWLSLLRVSMVSIVVHCGICGGLCGLRFGVHFWYPGSPLWFVFGSQGLWSPLWSVFGIGGLRCGPFLWPGALVSVVVSFWYTRSQFVVCFW